MFKRRVLSIVVKSAIFSFVGLASTLVLGQEDGALEEVIVVGSQIKGAAINTALPVSVITSDDIDALGLDSGEEFLENLAEMGLNYFTEAEAFSGGVNSARGDVGSYNLRNMGVGNTLVLLNGRRLVNTAGYQTELLGGDYVPTLSVNSNLIPTSGMERVEVLKDGASAIYGADAVAGVINNVIDSNYEGLSFTTKMTTSNETLRQRNRKASQLPALHPPRRLSSEGSILTSLGNFTKIIAKMPRLLGK